MAQSMNRSEMNKKGCLYAETAGQAFRKYKSAVITTDNKAYMKKFLQKVYEENQQNFFADFYYSILTTEQKEEFCAGLGIQEKEMLENFEEDSQQIYYQVNEEELDFLFEITAREWLFSTFYASDKKIMIWGNYHLEFPIFCETEVVLEFYIDLAKKCGLEWH